MSRLAWVCLAAALAGCTAPGPGNPTELCTVVCRCNGEGPLPSQQRACVEECVTELGATPIPATCEQCVLANDSSCRKLLEVCFLGGPCSMPDPDDPPPPGMPALQEENLR